MPYDDMPYEAICLNCPLRINGDTNCNARFSSYPAMDNFRKGMVATFLWAKFQSDKVAAIRQQLDAKEAILKKRKGDISKSENKLMEKEISELKEQLSKALGGFFSDFQDAESYRKPWENLFRLVDATEINRKGEDFFNLVAGMMGGLGDDFKSDIPKDFRLTQLDDKGLVKFEELISFLLYRERNYNMKEIEAVLPNLYRIKTQTDYIVWEEDNRMMRTAVLNFQGRLQTLIDMLEIGRKFNVDIFVSY
jgi:hypothetical protein